MSKKLFDYCIGNPPYQADNEYDTKKYAPPVYDKFIDASYTVADKVELIHPARFLFNAGSTPKEWNEKLLHDTNFKIIHYEKDSSKVFSNTDIKGGVVISYHDNDKEYDPIDIFTPYEQLNSIRKKICDYMQSNLSEIITNRGLYRYSKVAYLKEPEVMKKTSDARIAPSSFERMPSIFLDEKPNTDEDFIRIYGNVKGKRLYKWIKREYVKEVNNLYKYKVVIPKANGSGELGEILSTPVILEPGVGFTETYISIGEKDSKKEAEAILKYIKTKFLRILLGILKVTQNNPKNVWIYIPLQNFSYNSDINWDTSINNIDKQLYKKYSLSDEEIKFIESHAKEME